MLHHTGQRALLKSVRLYTLYVKTKQITCNSTLYKNQNNQSQIYSQLSTRMKSTVPTFPSCVTPATETLPLYWLPCQLPTAPVLAALPAAHCRCTGCPASCLLPLYWLPRQLPTATLLAAPPAAHCHSTGCPASCHSTGCPASCPLPLYWLPCQLPLYWLPCQLPTATLLAALPAAPCHSAGCPTSCPLPLYWLPCQLPTATLLAALPLKLPLYWLPCQLPLYWLPCQLPVAPLLAAPPAAHCHSTGCPASCPLPLYWLPRHWNCHSTGCPASCPLPLYWLPCQLPTATLLAALPAAWHFMVSAETSWTPVSILLLGETESLIYSFYLSVSAYTTVYADPSPRYTLYFRAVKRPRNNFPRPTLSTPTPHFI